MTTLVLVAHPDDETLGAGGWIKNLTETGESVSVWALCGGAPERQTEDQFFEACTILGVSQMMMFDYVDQSLHIYPSSELINKLATDGEARDSVDRYDRIITHGPYDLNDDHRKVFEAAMVLARPPWKGELYTMYIPSSTEWALGMFGDFRPNTFVELTGEQLDTKCQALEGYTTEVQEPYLPRCRTSLIQQARYWGQYVGAELAEPFQLVKRVL